MRKEDMVSDADLRKQYGVDDSGAYLEVDGSSNGTSRYSGQQEKVQISTTKPGAAERGGGGY